jgi:hypothetical protein
MRRNVIINCLFLINCVVFRGFSVFIYENKIPKEVTASELMGKIRLERPLNGWHYTATNHVALYQTG